MLLLYQQRGSRGNFALKSSKFCGFTLSSVCICGNALRRVVVCCIHSFVGITGEVFSDQKILSKILSKSTWAYITKASLFFKNDC